MGQLSRQQRRQSLHCWLAQAKRGGAAESVPLIVLTHLASEAAVRAALARIDAMRDVTASTRLLRIEEAL